MPIQRWKILKKTQHWSTWLLLTAIFSQLLLCEHRTDLVNFGLSTISQLSVMLRVLSLFFTTDELGDLNFIAILDQVTDFFKSLNGLVRA